MDRMVLPEVQAGDKNFEGTVQPESAEKLLAHARRLYASAQASIDVVWKACEPQEGVDFMHMYMGYKEKLDSAQIELREAKALLDLTQNPFDELYELLRKEETRLFHLEVAIMDELFLKTTLVPFFARYPALSKIIGRC